MMFSIILAILTAKLSARILRMFNKGATTFPGKIALHIKYDILNYLSKGVKIICVTGTNGKTTTCALIEHALKSNNLSYFINKSGANMITGVATAFIMNSNLFAKCKKEYAILECDENSLPLISRYIDAEIVVVTNVFRDQLDRYGEVSYTLSKIKEGIDNMPQSLLVLNGDCPLTYSLADTCSNDYITYGIDSDIGTLDLSDNRFCPFCSKELDYKSRTFAHLGSFVCNHCSYHRENPSVRVTDIVDVNELGCTFFMQVNHDNKLYSISLGGIYNVYNFCSAVAVLNALGINDFAALCDFSGAFGRMERFKNKSQNILLLLVKNPVGLSSCIKYVSKIQNDFDMAFSLNDKEADGTDISWIWDSSFEELKIKNSSVYTLGRREYDMALRLKYDGLTVTKIIGGEDYEALVDIIKSSKRDFVIFSTYTSMMNMRHKLIEHFGGLEFWQ